MAFPVQRMRRTRRTAQLRGLVRETELLPGDLVYPLFVAAGEDVRSPVGSMPGVFQLSINHAVEEARRAHRLGIPAVLLNQKDSSYGFGELVLWVPEQEFERARAALGLAPEPS